MRPDNLDRDTLFPSVDFGEALRDAFSKLRRNWLWLAAFVMVSAGLAVFYILTATALYTANGSILIDPRVAQNPDSSSQITPGLLLSDALTVDSELRVLTSREITAKVLVDLGGLPQTSEPEPSGSLTDRVRELFGWDLTGQEGADPSADLPADLQQQREFESQRLQFMQGLSVERSGESFVIDISYTSPDLRFALEAINTLIREYQRASGQRQVEMTENTQTWLSNRIEELGDNVRVAETAVNDYRRENGLLVSEGQLLPSEIALNTSIEELIRLRGQALAIEVQVEQLSEQIAAGEIEAVQIPAEERSRTLEEFEARHAELLQDEQELLLSWDESSQIVRDLRQQKSQVRQLILDEFRQIRDRIRNQGEALKRQVAATERVIQSLRAEYGEDVSKTVELRSLEREASAKRELYERLLEEYNRNAQLVSFNASPARVIAWAVAPDTKSSPKPKRILVLAVFAGLVVGIAVIFLNEALDSSFRSHRDIVKKLGLNYIGLIPSFRTEKRFSKQTETPRSKRWRRLGRVARKFDFAATAPTSVTAETMRNLQIQLSMQRQSFTDRDTGIALGFTSAVRDEGKSTTAFNFATFLAQRQERVALIDLDVISTEMSRLIEPVLPQSNKLADFIENPEAAIANLAGIIEFPGLAVIGNFDNAIQTSGHRDAEKIDRVLRFLRFHFDYVIVDLPPVQGAAETQFLAQFCDALVFVVKWGGTPREQVITSLSKRGLPREKILGALYTRANLRRYQSYNRDELNDYYV